MNDRVTEVERGGGGGEGGRGGRERERELKPTSQYITLLPGAHEREQEREAPTR